MRWGGRRRSASAHLQAVGAPGRRRQAAAGGGALGARPPGEGQPAPPSLHLRVDGRLVWPPRGARGFGYDPMFVADGMTETFAEIEPAAKHAVSHRADAFKKLVERLFV